MVALGAGDLGAAQTAGAHDLDAAGAHSHGAAHGVFHRTAEADALLELRGDVLGDELSVRIRRADLDDGEGDRLADHLLDGEADALDLRAALADDNARTRAVDIDADLRAVALDLDVRDTCGIQGLLQVLADLVVLNDQVADLLVTGIPAGIPIFDDADTHAVRINFLSHIFCLLPYAFSATTMVMWLVRLLMRYIRP